MADFTRRFFCLLSLFSFSPSVSLRRGGEREGLRVGSANDKEGRLSDLEELGVEVRGEAEGGVLVAEFK